MLVSLALLLACGQPEPNGPDRSEPGPTGTEPDPTQPVTEEQEETPSEYIYEEDEEAGPLHTVEEVEASIAEVLDVLTSVDPHTLTGQYEQMRVDGGDESCPYYYTDGDGDDYYGYQYWIDSCTAGGGTTFEGYGYSYYYEPYNTGGYRYEDQAYVQMFGTISDRLGNSLEMSGYFYHYTYGPVGSADRYGYAYLTGAARWDDDDAQGTWLAQDLSLDLVYSWSYDGDVDVGTALSVSGSLSGLNGDMNSALLSDFYLYAADAGSQCEQEPSGILSVRDAEGEWYHVEFQGPAWAGAPVFGPDCDGCGQVWYRGELLGEACPDFAALTAWEGRPWD